jgi:hypothetical protein
VNAIIEVVVNSIVGNSTIFGEKQTNTLFFIVADDIFSNQIIFALGIQANTSKGVVVDRITENGIETTTRTRINANIGVLIDRII